MQPDASRELLDLAEGPWRFHIVGIGGAAMNGIATMLVAMGHQVSGSDLKGSPVLDRLSGLGVTTFIGHDAAHIGDPDFLAFSSAIKADNVELAEARRRGIPALTRADVMAAICRERRTLAVSGTHGKTTTTAMLAAVFREAGYDPSYLVGGELSAATAVRTGRAVNGSLSKRTRRTGPSFNSRPTASSSPTSSLTTLTTSVTRLGLRMPSGIL